MKYADARDRDLRYAANALLRVATARRDGRWTPDQGDERLLRRVLLVLDALTGRAAR